MAPMCSTKVTCGLAFLAVVGALAVVPAQAHAQGPTPPTGDKVAAEALFEEGRKLVADAKYPEACPKFAESERLDASPSTLLNLANCWERLGRTATAWATYREAESAASAVHRQDYMETAARHARALSSALAHLTITVERPVEGMQVRRDGVVVGSAEWGLAIPVDAGSHTIEASAPGYKAWSAQVQVIRDGAQSALTVPALEMRTDSAPETRLETNLPAPTPPVSVGPVPDSNSSARPQRTTALAVAGVGLFGLGASAVFAVVAKGKYDDSVKNHCLSGHPNLCDDDGISLRNDARSFGNAATLALGIGAAALVAGGVLWFTVPRGSSRGPGATAFVILPTLGGVVAKGAF